MNSRERVLTALRHKEPDRVPIDFNSMAASSISAMAYNSLKLHLGITCGETKIWDPFQLLAIPERGIRSRFSVDTLPVRMPIHGLDIKNPTWKEWVLPDGSKGLIPSGFNPVLDDRGDWVILGSGKQVKHRLPQGGYYFDQVHYPLAEATSISEIEDYTLPDFTKEELAWMHDAAKSLYERTDKAIVCRFRGSILEKACSLRGWERYMMDLAIEPKLAHCLNQKLTDHYLENLPGFLDAVDPYSQVIVVHDDLGNQNNTLISVQMYRRMIKPYHRQIYQAIKTYSDMFLFMHSDGSIRNLIPDLIDVGVDILNPVQISARDMKPVSLKRDFGSDIVFWGAGADTQHVLPFSSPQEVRDHVRELMDIFSPGGGYVFNQIHNIQTNVPPENIVAMFEAAYEFGSYDG